MVVTADGSIRRVAERSLEFDPQDGETVTTPSRVPPCAMRGHLHPVAHLPRMTDITLGDAPATDATVRLAASGDEAAFARLVERHHASMARVAYAITGDVEAARDATQVAWATAWRRLHTLRDHGQVRAWLVAIAANEARQTHRKRGRRTVVDISEALDAAPSADPADRIGAVDLARALARLKPDDRTLLALRFAAGLDSTEIAAQLQLSPSGVRSRLARLIERLRTELDHA